MSLVHKCKSISCLTLHHNFCFLNHTLQKHFLSEEMRYKLRCTRTTCIPTWEWFPGDYALVLNENTRNTIILLKESRIMIFKHYFKLKGSKGRLSRNPLTEHQSFHVQTYTVLVIGTNIIAS